MLVDNINLTIRSGTGGKGAATMRPFKGGPDGGHGGRGGDIYVQGSHNINDLKEFRYKKIVQAEDGGNGLRQNKYGKNAQDITILVPLGTRISDLTTSEVIEIADVSTQLLAKGGEGGRGNRAFRSSTNQTPREFEHGKIGEERNLSLQLRLIAQIGLIGLPNAGKSSVLSVLTSATPTIGDYPFTTLEPTIGMLDTHAIADIPGLIEGASTGKGLGIDFLRHIEKTRILLHCIDVTSEDLLKSYTTIRDELYAFDPAMHEKKEYILLTKIDLEDKTTITKAKKIFTKLGKTVFTYSRYDTDSIESLKKKLVKILTA